MKHLIVSLTIGACLLLPSAGLVLGAPVPGQPAQNPDTGQPGSANGMLCANSIEGPPGNAGNSQSAFNPKGIGGQTYASSPLNPGTVKGAPNSTAAGVLNGAGGGQYDTACFH